MALKVAICYYGLASNVDNVEGTNAPNLPVNYLSAIQSQIDNVIGPNNADVFIHTWSHNVKDDLIQNYQPKKIIAEPQIDFKPQADSITAGRELWGIYQSHHILSRWYSTMKSIELKQQYEQENGFKYDFVMLTRFDCVYGGDWSFSVLDPSKLYITGGWMANYDEEYPDLWFILNSEDADKMATMYDNMPNLVFNNLYDGHANIWGGHLLVRRHIASCGLLSKVEHFKNHGSDSNIVRG